MLADKTYSGRLQTMVSDITSLNEKYDSYFDLHGIEDISDLVDVIQLQ